MKLIQFSAWKRKWILPLLTLSALAIAVPVALADEPVSVAVKTEYKLLVNGQEVRLAKGQVVIDDVIYLPLRATGEALGKSIEWNKRDGIVAIIDELKPNGAPP